MDYALNLYHLTSPEIIAHPAAFYDQLRVAGPLFWDAKAKLWICTGYEVAESILRDKERFGANRLANDTQLAAQGLEKLIPLYRLLRSQMLFQDGSTHLRLRAAIQRHFTASAVNKRQASIQALVDKHLIECAHVQHAGTIDLIDDFAGPLPTEMSAGLLNLPLSDMERFMRWNEAYDHALASFSGLIPLQHEHILKSLEEEIAYFIALIN